MRTDISAAWRGQRVLVTGASAGIGRAIAQAFARAGAHLVLTARRADRLEALAGELRAAHGVDVCIFAADLEDRASPDALFAFTQGHGLAIDVLVNNAGLIDYGEFHASDLARQLAMVQVHCGAVVQLTHRYLPGMIERHRGHVLVVATTLLSPAAYLATYAATKGFDLLFAEGLREEVARHGINVSALCPGPTSSEIALHIDTANAEAKHAFQPASEVAEAALAGLAARRACIRPSWTARIVAMLPRLLPRATVSGATEKLYRPASLRKG